jgi:hypothetical protein
VTTLLTATLHEKDNIEVPYATVSCNIISYKCNQCATVVDPLLCGHKQNPINTSPLFPIEKLVMKQTVLYTETVARNHALTVYKQYGWQNWYTSLCDLSVFFMMPFL